jgi:hypothetical protein
MRTRYTMTLLAVVLLAVTTLTACEGIPASPTPRENVNGVTIVDNPPYMNDNNLGILRYWWTYTHNPAIAAVATPDGLLDTTSSSSVPDNVAMAQAAWFQGEPGTRQNVTCALGVLFTGAAAVFAVANPPADLAGVAAAWFITGGPAVLSVSDCWDTFQWSVKDDAQPRWLADCTAAYLADDSWNMLNPAWEHSDMIKFQKCLVFGWAASRAIAAGIGERGNNDIVTLRGNYVCNVIIFPPGLECHWE